MHGCGNDYIYFDCFKQTIENPEELAVKLSDRHKSIGGDGIILVCPPDNEGSDCKMRIFNADGSEAMMCGNGIRCVAKFYCDNIEKKNLVVVDTLSGQKEVLIVANTSEAALVRVDMGAPILEPKLIPAYGESHTIDGYEATCISMGNPHAVVFTDIPVEEIDLPTIGKKFENNPFFPERVNTEFVNIIDDHTLKMRVWERGSGETQACGTGACAVAVAACLKGTCKRDTNITVELLGGKLFIVWTDDTVFMTGVAVEAFRGTVEI